MEGDRQWEVAEGEMHELVDEDEVWKVTTLVWDLVTFLLDKKRAGRCEKNVGRRYDAGLSRDVRYSLCLAETCFCGAKYRAVPFSVCRSLDWRRLNLDTLPILQSEHVQSLASQVHIRLCLRATPFKRFVLGTFVVGEKIIGT